MGRNSLFRQQSPGYNSTIEDVGNSAGNRFYVDSGAAGAGDTVGHGRHPDSPFATIDYAVGQCTANNGDIVYVLHGHTETISAADGIDLDVAGITIQGLGRGSVKPTVTLGTATTARLAIAAANVTLRNVRFVSNINDLAEFVNVSADYAEIEDCEFVTSSTKEAISFIQLATTKDYLSVRRCRFEQPTDPAGSDGGDGTGCLYVVDSEYILFEDCWFAGSFETAIFHNKTTACKHLWVKNCHGIQALSGAEPFQLVDGANGAMLGGGFITPAEAAATEATLVGTLGAGFFILPPGNFGNDGAAGGQGGIIVATAS